jgi:hypothetical protein
MAALELLQRHIVAAVQAGCAGCKVGHACQSGRPAGGLASVAARSSGPTTTTTADEIAVLKPEIARLEIAPGQLLAHSPQPVPRRGGTPTCAKR